MKEKATIQKRIEAILFASGKGASAEELANYISKSKQQITQNLKQLQQRYQEADTSLEIRNHNGKWKLSVKEAYVEDVKSIVSETELAAAILKTLAIIAYKSPVLQSDVIDMRGQGAYDHIRELVKAKFVTKEPHGRSYILKITEKFYEYFDVEGDEEIREVFERLREEQASQVEVVDIKEKTENATTEYNPQQTLTKDPDREEVTTQIVEEEPMTKKDVQGSNDDKAFLDEIEQKIQSSSQRIDKHDIPKQEKITTSQEDDTKTEETGTETQEENPTAQEESTGKQEETSKQNTPVEDDESKDEDPKKVLEQFVEDQNKDDEEQFL